MEKNSKRAQIIDILNAHAINEKRIINTPFYKLPSVGENKTMYFPLFAKEEDSKIMLPGGANKTSRKFKVHPSIGIVVSSEKYEVGTLIFLTLKGAAGELIIYNGTAYEIITNGSVLCYTDGLEFLKENLADLEWS